MVDSCAPTIKVNLSGSEEKTLTETTDSRDIESTFSRGNEELAYRYGTCTETTTRRSVATVRRFRRKPVMRPSSGKVGRQENESRVAATSSSVSRFVETSRSKHGNSVFRSNRPRPVYMRISKTTRGFYSSQSFSSACQRIESGFCTASKLNGNHRGTRHGSLVAMKFTRGFLAFKIFSRSTDSGSDFLLIFF